MSGNPGKKTGKKINKKSSDVTEETVSNKDTTLSMEMPTIPKKLGTEILSSTQMTCQSQKSVVTTVQETPSVLTPNINVLIEMEDESNAINVALIDVVKHIQLVYPSFVPYKYIVEYLYVII